MALRILVMFGIVSRGWVIGLAVAAQPAAPVAFVFLRRGALTKA